MVVCIGEDTGACLVPVIENTENTILVLSENYSCSLNLMFFVFSMFFITKKIWEPYTCSSYFPCCACFFSEQKTVFKNCNQTCP